MTNYTAYRGEYWYDGAITRGSGVSHSAVEYRPFDIGQVTLLSVDDLTRT